MKQDLKESSQKEKFALLGEMFENIIHQFKQPLNAITTEATGIKFQNDMGMITDEILYESLDNIINRANYLADTIDDFRNFLQEDKEKIIFKIAQNIQKVESIINPILTSQGISIYKEFQDDDIECNGYDREFSQVIINILNNAKDALLISNPDKKIIKIDITNDKDNITLNIYDNAGGIPENILNQIFDNHFTTKQEIGGTGIGLNMSRTIIEEHFKGKLLAINTKFTLNENSYYGACFTITIPYNI